jgi:hypothetical protein
LNTKKLLSRAVEKWPVKVLSVAAALVLFVFHRMSTLETRFFSVPLAVETGADLVPISSYPRFIKVTLRGDANSIYPIVENDIEAYIDLKKHRAEGWYRAPVQIRKKGSAVDVEPLEISVDPLEVSLQLDHRIVKTLSLAANIRGSPASGFELVSHSLFPAQVAAEGPRLVLEPLSQLGTEAVDLEGRSEDFTITVNILNPDSRIVTRGSKTAEFRGRVSPVPVSAAMRSRDFDGIPVAVKGLNPGFQANWGGATGSVRLQGERTLLDTFKPPDDFLSLDCSGLHEPGTYTLPVLISVPPEFSSVHQEPRELIVVISIRDGGAP